MLELPKYNMSEKLFNANIMNIEELDTPQTVFAEYPVTDKVRDLVLESREIVKKIIKEDKRFLAVVGPCSIHDTEAALDYARRLLKLQESKDTVYFVMRVYFEKPRTIMGWKGLINDPDLNGTFNMQQGLRKARKLLLEINEMGLPCATEMLDPLVPQYIADLISWSAIGARTTESQTHRQMASGLSMPVGFKNGTTGDLLVATNAIASSNHQHRFIGVDQSEGKIKVFHTAGNPDAHLVLRGGTAGPNYEKPFVDKAVAELETAGLRTGIMVDTNHANSGKDPNKQPIILKTLLTSVLMVIILLLELWLKAILRVVVSLFLKTFLDLSMVFL